MFFLPLLFLLNLLGIRLYIRYARQQALLDNPNARSSHQVPTVRGGGILFGPTFIAVSLCLYGLQEHWATLAVLLVWGISLLDDIRGLPARLRLPVHLMAVGLILLATQAQWPWWGWVLGILLLGGWLNAFNFMDGINGITALYAAVLLATLIYLGYREGEELQHFLPEGAVFMAVLAFTSFNFRKKARCFAGDVGSVSLALIIGWAVLRQWSGPASIHLLLLPALYAVDAVLTICIRLSRGENIFEPHRQHLYQLLANELAWDHRHVAALYAGGQLLLNVLVILLLRPLPPGQQIIGTIFTYILLCGAYLLLRFQYLAPKLARSPEAALRS